MQGSALVVELFKRSYVPVDLQWQTDLAERGPTAAQLSICQAPSCEKVDLSLGICVDDLGKTHPVPTCAEAAAEQAFFSNKALDAALKGNLGAERNVGKLVMVPCFVRRGSAAETRQASF